MFDPSGGPGFGQIMQQVQQFKEKLDEMQRQLQHEQVEAEVAGGMVKVVANGRREIVSISIEKEVVDPEDVGMLEDLVQAAVNSVLAKVEAHTKRRMEETLGPFAGMMPGLLG